jgi:hypothetical protein
MTYRCLGLITFCIVILLLNFAYAGNITHVPADQPTIQAGINAATNGDTILVSPGTYNENINFNGKAITVKSSGGTSVTTIDGGGIAPVVTFDSNETSSSLLTGFTIQNGDATNTYPNEGGGIQIESGSPSIKGNIVQNSKASNGGGGIGIGFASPLIQNNIIRNNKQTSGYSGGIGGGGITVRGASSAQIIGNTIQSNNWNSASGGGISLFGAGAPVIMNNLIIGNSSNQGGGISMFNEADEIIVQNLIVENSALEGAGIYSSVPQSSTGFRLLSNTIANNNASAAVVADGFNSNAQIINNLIIAPTGQSALVCNPNYKDGPPIVQFNDAFTPQGNSYDGMCTGFSGTNGNISAKPTFVGVHNYRLKGGSAGIDVGDNSAPGLPSTDYAGNPRIINGNDGATAIVDIGAYEFNPVVLAPKSLGFGLQAVGSSTSKTAKLTNAQNKILNISSISAPTGYAVSGCGSTVPAYTSCNLTVTFHPLGSGTFNGPMTVTDDAGTSPQSVSLSGKAQ